MRKWILGFAIITICLLVIPPESVKASNGNGVIEFTITEKINLEGDGKGCELVSNPGAIEIINSGDRGIVIESIEAETKNGWELVEETYGFSKLASDSKKLSIVLADGHSLTKEYQVGQTIFEGERTAIPIAAKTGPVTKAVSNECVVNLITTLKPAEIPEDIYEYPTIDFLAAEETFDHSLFDYGVTRTIVGASSIKLVFDRDLYLCTTGEYHSIVIMNGDYESPYDADLLTEELVLSGDTAMLWVDLVNKKGNKDLDIRTLSMLDVVVTFIPLDENGNEIPITKETIIYDEDMNIIPPVKRGGNSV